MMKVVKFLFVMLFCGTSVCFANDVLPQIYTPNNINPYQTKESWFRFVRSSHDKLLQPNFYHSEKIKKDESKYNNVLSRMEREWFGIEFVNHSEEERVEKLEEKVFGTIHDGDIKSRVTLLQKAFDARKIIKQQNMRNMYSGLPTSIPMNVDELLEN